MTTALINNKMESYKVKMHNDFPALEEFAKELLKAAEAEADKKTSDKLFGYLDEVIKFYASESKQVFINAAKDAEEPAMHYAVKNFEYPVIRLKQTVDKDTNAVKREIVKAAKGIDLLDLHKALRGVGADTNWVYKAENFNYYMTVRAAEDVSDERLQKVLKDNSCFIMDEISRAFEVGKNPTSNNNLVKQLEKVVQMMLGEEYHIAKKDFNYLMRVFLKDNGKSRNGITAANHRAFAGMLKKVCYRVLTGSEWEVVTKLEKKES